MHVHHLNCGCMCPVGGAIFDGFSRGWKARLVCHCLLIETDRGLVLIDTGFGVQDIQSPYSRLSPFFIYFNNMQFDRKYTAIAQIEQLGFSARDVRHIVLTHLDFDHAGVAIATSEGWLLHAGDAYFYRHEMDAAKPRCTPGLRAYQRLMEVDRQARLFNQNRLRQLASDRAEDMRLFCSHDAVELEAFTRENKEIWPSSPDRAFLPG